MRPSFAIALYAHARKRENENIKALLSPYLKEEKKDSSEAFKFLSKEEYDAMTEEERQERQEAMERYWASVNPLSG